MHVPPSQPQRLYHLQLRRGHAGIRMSVKKSSKSKSGVTLLQRVAGFWADSLADSMTTHVFTFIYQVS